MRLINADALDKILADAEIEARHNKRYVLQGAINTIRGNVAKMPTIEEQRTGKWIDKWHNDSRYCDQCGAVLEGDYWYWRNNYYCYHCGAKMEGVEDDK